MPEIKLVTKPDTTFLNLLLYEGVLFLIKQLGGKVEFGYDKITVSMDAYRILLKKIDKSIVERLDILFVGNDRRYGIPTKILRDLDIGAGKAKITRYSELFKQLITERDKLFDAYNDELVIKITRNTLFVGNISSKPDVSMPQLFKIDRYTGLTSLEAGTTYVRYGLKATKTTMLLGLLGILSSYVVEAGAGRDSSYYFLFYTPDEILWMLTSGDHVLVDNMYSFKKLLVDKLREVLRARIPEEIILLEILIDLKLVNELEKLGLDQAVFLLYRVVPEGNTYKIYNVTPITLYSRPHYLDELEGIVRDKDGFLEVLVEALSPGNAIMEAVYSLNTQNKYPEADQLLEALYSLYRFIALGLHDGLYGFIRGLENAYNEVKDKEPGRARFYSYVLNRLNRYL